MKKNILLGIAFSAIVSVSTFAQVATTPEVPRNYKPQPKELLAMPAELTDQTIFPVLGYYAYTNADGEVINVVISKDSTKKGTVWVNGMPQGKFKADLRVSPATYKIPAQKTLMNEAIQEASVSAEPTATEEAQKPQLLYSGKSMKEGTLLFDSVTQKLYINEGARYNEETPAAIFPELNVADSTVNFNSQEAVAVVTPTPKKKSKVKKRIDNGTNYILTKIVEVPVGTTEEK